MLKSLKTEIIGFRTIFIDFGLHYTGHLAPYILAQDLHILVPGLPYIGPSLPPWVHPTPLLPGAASAAAHAEGPVNSGPGLEAEPFTRQLRGMESRLRQF